MIYHVTKNFIKIDETQGTIQNTRNLYNIEVSDKAEPNSGILLARLDKCSFSGAKYIRCIGGKTEVRVVPFFTDFSGGSSTDDFNQQMDSILSGDERFADDFDLQQDIDDIFNGKGNPIASDTDFDSALDDIFNP